MPTINFLTIGMETPASYSPSGLKVVRDSGYQLSSQRPATLCCS
jgi:hypothetical protein